MGNNLYKFMVNIILCGHGSVWQAENLGTHKFDHFHIFDPPTKTVLRPFYFEQKCTSTKKLLGPKLYFHLFTSTKTLYFDQNFTSTKTVLRLKLYFDQDCTSTILLRPKLYFDLFTSTSLLRPLYFDQNFTSTKTVRRPFYFHQNCNSTKTLLRP